MTRDEIKKQFLDLAEDTVFEQITDESYSFLDNGWDSLDSVDIVFACEEHFRIAIPDEDIFYLELGNVGYAIDYLLKKVNEK